MKIVTDQISSHSTSANDIEVNSIQKPDSISMTDFDQVKGDLNIFPENLSDSICQTKDAYPLQLEFKDYTIELLGDGCADVKESQTEVGFDDPSELSHSKIRDDMDNHTHSSTNASGMDLEHLAFKACSRVTDGSAVRDIWIDEIVAANDKNTVEVIVDGFNLIDKDSDTSTDKKYDSVNIKAAVEWLVPAGLESMTDEANEKDFNSHGSNIQVQQSESNNGKTVLVSSDLQKDKATETVIAEDTYAEECLSEKSILHQESVAEFEDATDKLICSSSTSDATFMETAEEGMVETSDLNIVEGRKALNNNEVELHSNLFHPRMREQQNLASDHLTASARIQRDHFESSFASVGPYTNSIAYSGSISHRSDASTVSTRSFAFPVLQNEWNFSPVRMRKADRRHFGKRRGWMSGLFCCKF